MRSRWAARFLVGALVALAGAVPAGAVNVAGSNGPDTIYGTGRADRIDGRGGNDQILGFGGADVLTGGPGSDRILAGSGNDRVRLRDGRRDVVDCGPGRDTAVVDAADTVRRC